MTLQYNTGVPSIVFRTDSVLSGGGGRSSNIRQDSSVDVAFFAEQLKSYDERAFKIIKGDLVAMGLFPVRMIDAGALSYNYSMYNSTGMAEYNTARAKNAPIVNTSAKQYTTPIASMNVAYEFTAEDVEASRFARSRPHLPNYDPIQVTQEQCLRACMERMDKTCFQGYPDLGLKGIIGNPAVTNYKGVPVLWNTATPQQILADLLDAFQSTYVSTLNTLKPDTCVMSLALFNQIQMTIFNTFNGTTILQIFESQTNVKVIPAAELNKAFYAGNASGIWGGGVDGFFMFKNDPLCIEHVVAIMFEADMPIKKESGFAYTVPCRARHAGLVIRQPLTCAIRSQIVGLGGQQTSTPSDTKEQVYYESGNNEVQFKTEDLTKSQTKNK